MTYSILARDPSTGALGCATATGTPVVGGFVLHAATGVGVVATQGLSTSTLYGPQALARLAAGEDPEAVVAALTQADAGRDARQLAVMDASGRADTFTGADNLDECCVVAEPGLCVAANWVATADLAERVADAYRRAEGPLVLRLLAALEAGAAAGGDARGNRSAALRIVDPAAPAVDLRADDDAPDPVARLRAIHRATQEPGFQRFLAGVPTLADPWRRGFRP